MELRTAAALTSSKAVITRAHLVALLDEFDALLAASQPKRKAAAKKAAAAPVGDLPAWLPLEPWEAFLAMRVKIKKPATEYAQRLLIKKLDGFRGKGFSVVDVLDQSITSGWQDLYAPKDQQFAHGQGYQPTPQRVGHPAPNGTILPMPGRPPFAHQQDAQKAAASAEAKRRLTGRAPDDGMTFDMEPV